MAGFHLLQNKALLQQYNSKRRDGHRLSGLCVIHTAENISALKGRDLGAENVAAFTLSRDTYGSYHVIVDADSRVDMVPWEFEAFHCRPTNRFSAGISLAVMAADWPKLYKVEHGQSDRGHVIIDQAARAAADFVEHAQQEHGITVPTTRIPLKDALVGKPGFIAHGDTDPSRRSDPGKDFDWDYFFNRVRHHLESSRITEDPVATMANPAEGRVSSEYGWRPALSPRIPKMLHAGIDIANKTSTPIFAAFAGRIIASGWNVVSGRTGQGVLIENPDGEKQYYGHLDTLDVRKGDSASLGQQIGTMGATGNVTGPHLHFEAWKRDGSIINPRIAFKNHGVTPGVHNLTSQSFGAGTKPKTDTAQSSLPTGTSTSDSPARVRRRYYTRTVDGEAGPYTVKAIQAFLADRGLYDRAIDGSLGPYTWRGLQRYLSVDGFYSRAADGKAGPHTIKAVQTWLTRAGLYDRAVDGDIGTHTWRALQGFLARERWVTLTIPSAARRPQSSARGSQRNSRHSASSAIGSGLTSMAPKLGDEQQQASNSEDPSAINQSGEDQA